MGHLEFGDVSTSKFRNLNVVLVSTVPRVKLRSRDGREVELVSPVSMSMFRGDKANLVGLSVGNMMLFFSPIVPCKDNCREVVEGLSRSLFRVLAVVRDGRVERAALCVEVPVLRYLCGEDLRQKDFGVRRPGRVDVVVMDIYGNRKDAFKGYVLPDARRYMYLFISNEWPYFIEDSRYPSRHPPFLEFLQFGFPWGKGRTVAALNNEEAGPGMSPMLVEEAAEPILFYVGENAADEKGTVEEPVMAALQYDTPRPGKKLFVGDMGGIVGFGKDPDLRYKIFDVYSLREWNRGWEEGLGMVVSEVKKGDKKLDGLLAVTLSPIKYLAAPGTGVTLLVKGRLEDLEDSEERRRLLETYLSKVNPMDVLTRLHYYTELFTGDPEWNAKHRWIKKPSLMMSDTRSLFGRIISLYESHGKRFSVNMKSKPKISQAEVNRILDLVNEASRRLIGAEIFDEWVGSDRKVTIKIGNTDNNLLFSGTVPVTLSNGFKMYDNMAARLLVLADGTVYASYGDDSVSCNYGRGKCLSKVVEFFERKLREDSERGRPMGSLFTRIERDAGGNPRTVPDPYFYLDSETGRYAVLPRPYLTYYTLFALGTFSNVVDGKEHERPVEVMYTGRHIGFIVPEGMLPFAHPYMTWMMSMHPMTVLFTADILSNYGYANVQLPNTLFFMGRNCGRRGCEEYIPYMFFIPRIETHYRKDDDNLILIDNFPEGYALMYSFGDAAPDSGYAPDEMLLRTVEANPALLTEYWDILEGFGLADELKRVRDAEIRRIISGDKRKLTS